MSDPLQPFCALANTPAEATRWACVLEATAPKAGNVYPGRSFADLSYSDFVVAADIAASCFDDPGTHWSEQVFEAVAQTTHQVGTNVNLGILLLIAPLISAEHLLPQSLAHDSPFPLAEAAASEFVWLRWQRSTETVLQRVNKPQSRRLLAAIAAASPGGLGEVNEMDVRNPDADHGSIIDAMTLAADRDRVALQYANGFADLFQSVLPVVREAILEAQDVLAGIRLAHLRLLAQAPDTLIARKVGIEVARDVQRRAANLDPSDLAAVEIFDRYLRRDGNRLNPGTTADLLAASLYVLLRTPSIDDGSNAL